MRARALVIPGDSVRPGRAGRQVPSEHGGDGKMNVSISNQTAEEKGLLYYAEIKGVTLAMFAARLKVFLVDCRFEQFKEDDKAGEYTFIVDCPLQKVDIFLTLAQFTVDPLVIRLRVHSAIERKKPDAFVASLNPWLELYYATRLEKGGDPASPTGKTQTGAGALSPPEDLLVSLPGNRGSNEWWTAYFDWEIKYKKQHRWTNRNGYDLLGYGKSEYDRKKGLWKAEHGAE